METPHVQGTAFHYGPCMAHAAGAQHRPHAGVPAPPKKKFTRTHAHTHTGDCKYMSNG